MKRVLYIIAVSCMLVLFLSGQIVWGQIPQTMSYQGVLTNTGGEVVFDGNYTLTFKMYDAAIGGQTLWSEIQMVSVINGLFKVILGSDTPLNLPFDRQYWLGTSVGEEPELLPRIELTASPYSLYAHSVADSAITSSKIASGQVVKSINSLHDSVNLIAGENVTIAQSGSSLVISAKIGPAGKEDNNQLRAGSNNLFAPGEGEPWKTFGNLKIDPNEQFLGTINSADLVIKTNNAEQARVTTAGNIGIGTTNPVEKLDVAGTVQMIGLKLPTGAASNYILTSDANGVGSWRPAFSGISGSGMTNYLPKFTGTTTIGASGIFEYGNGNVGIGTTIPENKLHVADGNIRVSHSSTQAGFHANAASGFESYIDFEEAGTKKSNIYWDGSSDKLVINDQGATIAISTNGGNVGIGTINPQNKLHVANGNIRLSNSSTHVGFHINAANGFASYIDFEEAGTKRSGIYWDGPSDKLIINDQVTTVAISTNGGNVGIGTTNPVANLHVSTSGSTGVRLTGSIGNVQAITIGATNGYAFGRDGSDRFFINRDVPLGTASLRLFTIMAGGAVGIGDFSAMNPVHPLHMASGAYCSTAGVWTNASSRAYKTDIQPLKTTEYSEILEKLEKIDVVRFKYKVDPDRHHIGLIAEDVPDEIASEDRKGVPTGEAIAFLMAALKAQQAEIEKLEKRLKELEGGNLIEK